MIIIILQYKQEKQQNSFLNVLLSENIREYTNQHLSMNKNFKANVENSTQGKKIQILEVCISHFFRLPQIFLFSMKKIVFHKVLGLFYTIHFR